MRPHCGNRKLFPKIWERKVMTIPISKRTNIWNGLKLFNLHFFIIPTNNFPNEKWRFKNFLNLYQQDKQTNRQTDKQINSKIDKQTKRQKDKKSTNKKDNIEKIEIHQNLQECFTIISFYIQTNLPESWVSEWPDCERLPEELARERRGRCSPGCCRSRRTPRRKSKNVYRRWKIGGRLRPENVEFGQEF